MEILLAPKNIIANTTRTKSPFPDLKPLIKKTEQLDHLIVVCLKIH
jgi:hypothetical protein